MDEILNKQRFHVKKTVLGYTNTKPLREDEGNCANSLRSENNKQKGVEEQWEHDTSCWRRRPNFKKFKTLRSFSNRYENIFLALAKTLDTKQFIVKYMQ